MRPLPRWRLHELMQQQAIDRRETGRSLQAGDIVQAHVGGDVRIIVWCTSAGDCIEGLANQRALDARTERPGEDRG